MKKVLFVLITIMLFTSCNNDDETITESTIDKGISISNLEYVSETIHDSYFGEVGDRYYNSVSLTIGLDDPSSYEQIERMIIYNNDVALGWEFSKDVLANAFVDTLGGFFLEHIVYIQRYYDPYNYNPYYPDDRIYSVTSYNEQNEIIDEYDFLLKGDFPSIVRLETDWYDKSSLLIKTNGLYRYPDLVNVIYLNGLEIIDIAQSQVNSSEFILDNVPDNCDSFFLEYVFYSGNQKQVSISEIEYLGDRIPSNAIVLPENISIDHSLYLPNTNMMVFMDYDNSKIYYWDVSIGSITNEIKLPSKPSSMALDQTSIYIGLENGALYEILENYELSFLYNFGARINTLTKAGDYIITNISYSYSEFWIYSINENVANQHGQDSYNIWTHSIYNNSTNVIYFTNDAGNDGIIRMNINPSTGELSDYRNTYYYDIRAKGALKLFPDKSKVISASGSIFSCESSYSNDLGFVSNVPVSFTDMVFSDDNKFIMIYSYTSNYYGGVDVPGSIMIVNSTTSEIEKSLSLYGTPLSINSLTDDYLVLSKVEISDRYFLQRINKIDFEASSLGKHTVKYFVPNL